MPDPDERQGTDEETLPRTSQHAYKDGRDEDVQHPERLGGEQEPHGDSSEEDEETARPPGKH